MQKKNLKEEEQVKLSQGEEGKKNIQEPGAPKDNPTPSIIFRYKQVTFSEHIEQSNETTSVPLGGQEEQTSLQTDEDQEDVQQDAGENSKMKILNERG